MIQLHSTSKAVRLSEEALGRLCFSNEPTADKFSLLRYKKTFESLIASEQATEQDIAALGMVYFNLDDKINFEKCFTQNMEKFNSNPLLAIYVIGRLHSKWLGESEELDEDILSYWFNHRLNQEKVQLEFISHLNEIPFLGNLYELKHTLSIMISISNDRIVTISAGPLKYETEYELIPKANFRYQFTKDISIDIANKSFGREKKEFLEYYLGEKSFNSALEDLTPKEISSVPDRSKYIKANI